ncbi:MAG TPA: hypothetical protein PKH31_06390 [Candidatus Sumerlaeota bacterium]|nr:hypothetical protein [Candidatus Sumerlaeota bacterium]
MPWEQKQISGYLVDVDTGERLEFQHNPNDIGDEKSTDYAAIKIPGLSHPRYQYVAGEARRITLRIELFKGPVKEQVHWLRSLLYPEHAGTMLKNAPHRVLLLFGDLYPGVLCVVRQVKARYFHLFDRDSLLPQHAEVEIVLEEYVEESVNWQEVRL